MLIEGKYKASIYRQVLPNKMSKIVMKYNKTHSMHMVGKKKLFKEIH